jgi:hypothetical protein
MALAIYNTPDNRMKDEPVEDANAAAASTAEPPGDTQGGDRLPCPMCREPLRKGAKICIRCKSDLTWRRYLFFGNTSLALLTALVAVVAATGPTIKALFEMMDSDVHGVFVGMVAPNPRTPNGQVSLLTTNHGSRIGAITGGFLSLSEREHSAPAGTERRIDIPLTPEGESPRFIAARTTEPLRLSVASKGYWAKNVSSTDAIKSLVAALSLDRSPATRVLPAKCEIQIQVINASGFSTEDVFPAWCQGVAGAIRRAAEASLAD